MAKKTIPKNLDRHSRSEELLHNQSKEPLQVWITREDYYLIQRTKMRLAGLLYDLALKISELGSIACSLKRIYDDVIFVESHLRCEVEKAEGGAA